jgi:hypothetical protein
MSLSTLHLTTIFKEKRRREVTRQQKWLKRRNATLVAAGLCVDCGILPHVENRKRCKNCLKKSSNASKKSQEKNVSKGLCAKGCGNKARENETCCESCAADNNRRSRSRYRRLREEAVAAYGGKKCVCCGENEPAFLSIDHIDGGGNQHKKEVGKGAAFYRWLRDNSYPSGFQVLCMNCQFGKRINGVCPHQQT